MRRRGPIEYNDSGESLLEILVALTILAICVVAIGSGIVLSIKMSEVHRSQASAQDYLHNYAETLESATYVPCASATTYASAIAPVGTPTGFSAPIVSIKYWVVGSASFAASCSTDGGLEQVTFTLQSTDNLVSESLVTTIRSSS
jgi:Tfp pilus assembly protein PilV